VTRHESAQGSFESAAAGLVMGTRQFLSFRLGITMRKTRGHSAVTGLPQTPPRVREAMKQHRFCGGLADDSLGSGIIEVSVGGRQASLLVDALNEVGAGASFVGQGLGRHGERLITQLNLQQVMT